MSESRDREVPPSEPNGELWAARNAWEKAQAKANDEERSVDSAYHEIVRLVEIGDLQGAKDQMEVRQSLLLSFAIAALTERRAKRALDDAEMTAMADEFKRHEPQSPDPGLQRAAIFAAKPMYHVRFDVDVVAADEFEAEANAKKEINLGDITPGIEIYHNG